MNNIFSQYKTIIFYILSFLILFLSFYLNLFKILPEKEYENYETFVEALVLGKMAKADKNGLFSSSGFPGVNYDKALLPDSVLQGDQINDLDVRDQVITQFKLSQYDFYTGNQTTPDDYCVYVSHSGGQAMFYYLIQKVLPFDKAVKYQLLRFINCALLALCFVIFLGWVYRNFSLLTAGVTFVFIFLSSWFVLFSGNGLWWSLWNFYVPFLVPLLLLEKKHKNPKSITDKKIFLYIFLAVLVKLFFSGLEFITTSLLIIFIPVLYYFILEKRTLINFVKYSIKSGFAALAAVLIQFIVLIIQLKYLLGGFDKAYTYIINAFVRRSSFDTGITSYDQGERFADSNSISFIWNNVIKDYLRGNAFDWGFVSFSFPFFFTYLIGFILISSIVLVLITKNLSDRKYIALVVSTYVSVVCPLSWFVIFKEHAFWHPQIDFIIWYMPFLLLGFVIIGAMISQLVRKK